MGFWKTLGMIGGIAAAPFTGGASAWAGPLIGAGADLIGAKMQSGAAGKAAETMQQYNREALEFLKQQDARDFAEYQQERQRKWGLEDAHEQRMTPYRDFGAQGVKNLSSLLTIPQGGVMYRPHSAVPKLSDLLRG